MADVLFQVTASNLASIYDAFDRDVTAEIKRMRELGISDDEIAKRLTENLMNGQDLFRRFKGALELELDKIVGVQAQAESNIYTPGTVLKWELDPTAREHCDTCLRNEAKEPMAIEEWEALGLPGFGNTECGQFCRCTLVVT